MDIVGKRRAFVLPRGVPRSERFEVEPALEERVRAFYEEGRYLDAFEASRTAGPLQAWKGARALEVGSRLASNVGSMRLAQLLALRGHREHPHDPRLALLHAYGLMLQHGPMPAWLHLRRFEQRETVADDPLAELLAFRASIAAGYRDFETAQQLLERAFALQPCSPWLRVEKAAVLLARERREEALHTVDEALDQRPWFRPAVQFRARLLHVLNRREEAVAYLTQATSRLQSSSARFSRRVTRPSSESSPRPSATFSVPRRRSGPRSWCGYARRPRRIPGQALR